MVKEVSKSFARRSSDHRFATRWFIGDGIDIGPGDDPLSDYAQFFPLIRSVRSWDRSDGDAMRLASVADEAYDFVHSNHRLAGLADATEALRNWVRICRPGGHLIITVPDEDLYEQGVFPSTFNAEHQWTFTIGKTRSWSSKSINVIDLLKNVVNEVEILKIELLDAGFRYGEPRQDQTLGRFSESAIEVVLRKRGEPTVPRGRGFAFDIVEGDAETGEAQLGESPQTASVVAQTTGEHVLIQRRDGMGDVIMTTPVAARLRQVLGPDATINIETNQRGVYINNPHVDGVNVPEPAGGYQRVIDLNGAYEMRPRMHAIDAYMLVAFGDTDWPDKQVIMHKAAMTEAPDLPWDRAVALHAGHSSAANRTFPYSFWEEVIDRLIAAGLTPVAVGAREDLSWTDKEGVVDLTHRLTIQQIATVIDRCSCFLCGDTGLMQVAGSTMTPIVGLYTSVRPEYRIPFRNGVLGWRITTLLPELDCVGCAADEPLPVTALSCRRGDRACVGDQRVKPSAVVEAVTAFTEKR